MTRYPISNCNHTLYDLRFYWILFLQKVDSSSTPLAHPGIFIH
jgi:hypothetical protein